MLHCTNRKTGCTALGRGDALRGNCKAQTSTAEVPDAANLYQRRLDPEALERRDARLSRSSLAVLLDEVLPTDGEAMGLVCAKGRIRQKYHCTNVQFEQALCLAAASRKIKRVFGGAMLARDSCVFLPHLIVTGPLIDPQQHTCDAGQHRKNSLAAWLPDLLGRAAQSSLEAAPRRANGAGLDGRGVDRAIIFLPRDRLSADTLPRTGCHGGFTPAFSPSRKASIGAKAVPYNLGACR